MSAVLEFENRLPAESLLRENFKAIAISATRIRTKNSLERDEIEKKYKYYENYFCYLLRCQSSLSDQFKHYLYDKNEEFYASQSELEQISNIAYETNDYDEDDYSSFTHLNDSNSLLDFND